MTVSEHDAQALESVLAAGLSALDEDDLDRAEERLDEARKLAGENHPQVLHLAGLLALAEGQTERGLGFLMQATDQAPQRAEIYLDCAEALLIAGDDLTEAEIVIRQALDLPDITDRQRAEAVLTLAQIQLDRGDLSGARERLEEVESSLRDHPAYLLTKCAVLLADGRGDDAVEAARRAVELEPEDADYRYQLALILQDLGRTEAAADEMVRVWEMDGGQDASSHLDPEEAALLRELLDQALSELPDPLLEVVGPAKVRVQVRASREQVRSGVDPRSGVWLVGGAQGGEGPPKVEEILVFRDQLLDGWEDEDEVLSKMVSNVVDGLRVLLGPEKVLVAEATFES